MKKTIVSLLGLVVLMFGLIVITNSNVVNGYELRDNESVIVDNAEQNESIDTLDNKYLYIVTDVINGEIYGTAINNVSDDNSGIYLIQSELDSIIHVGDTISVKYGEFWDEIESVSVVE